jgi:hypothetical protein
MAIDSGFQTPPPSMVVSPYRRLIINQFSPFSPTKRARDSRAGSEDEQYFKNPFELSSLADQRIKEFVDNFHTYSLKDRTLSVLTQTSPSNCGAICVNMLLLDLILNNKIDTKNPLIRKEIKEFSIDANKYGRGSSSSDLVESFHKKVPSLKIKEEYWIPEELKNPKEKILRDLKTIIDSKNTSVAIVLSLPKDNQPKGLHWVNIDDIDQNFVYLRDPFTGKAFKEDLATLKKYLYCDGDMDDLDCPIHAVYIDNHK